MSGNSDSTRAPPPPYGTQPPSAPMIQQPLPGMASYEQQSAYQPTPNSMQQMPYYQPNPAMAQPYQQPMPAAVPNVTQVNKYNSAPAPAQPIVHYHVAPPAPTVQQPVVQNSIQNNIVVGAVTQSVPGPYVPDKMMCSIFNLICCGCLLGIPAIILASQANSLRSHDPQRALSKARAARALNIVGFVLGIGFIATVGGLSTRTATVAYNYSYNN